MKKLDLIVENIREIKERLKKEAEIIIVSYEICEFYTKINVHNSTYNLDKIIKINNYFMRNKKEKVFDIILNSLYLWGEYMNYYKLQSEVQVNKLFEIKYITLENLYNKIHKKYNL